MQCTPQPKAKLLAVVKLGDIPKILAPIEGKPFLSWMLDWISSWSLEFESNIIISTGIGHKKVNKYCLEKPVLLEFYIRF